MQELATIYGHQEFLCFLSPIYMARLDIGVIIYYSRNKTRSGPSNGVSTIGFIGAGLLHLAKILEPLFAPYKRFRKFTHPTVIGASGGVLTPVRSIKSQTGSLQDTSVPLLSVGP